MVSKNSASDFYKYVPKDYSNLAGYHDQYAAEYS